MATVRPFRALRFTEAAGAPDQLVCPPYDIISEEERQAYLHRNPNNIVRLELPRDGNDPYAQAGDTLRRMLAEGILKREDAPALYVYEIEYILPGTSDISGMEGGTRRLDGLIAEVQLEPFDKGVILPHEHTLSAAKADRLRLMESTGCNFSNIYCLYRDDGSESEIRDITALAMQETPTVTLTDEAGLNHRLWVITDEGLIAAVCARFADKTLYIADGHHRYETALNYRDEQRAAGVPEGAPCDSVMMMLVDMAHPGLTVFPTHRLLRNLPGFSADALLAACASEFRAETGLPLTSLDERLEHAYREGETSFGFFTGGDTVTILTLRDKATMDTALQSLSPASRHLDVTVLHNRILERLLGIDEENLARQINLTYTRNLTEAITAVNAGAAQAAFLLNPTRVSEIRDVAAAGEKMPQKSTYFYPKLITGLTLRECR